MCNMKSMKKAISVITLITILSLTSLVAFADDLDYGADGALSTSSPTLTDMLTYAIQDEYTAKAEYEEIINQYGSIRPFTNIISAEETHISLLLPLFDQLNLTIPEDTSENHIIIPTTLIEAYQTGVTAEIKNIEMYDLFLEQDLPDDVRLVFEQLRNASINHLSAFQNALERIEQTSDKQNRFGKSKS